MSSYLVNNDMLMQWDSVWGVNVKGHGWRTVISSNPVPDPPCPVPFSNMRRAIPLVTNVNLVFLDTLLSSLIEYPTKESGVPTAFFGSPSS